MQIVEFIKNDISSLTKITLDRLNQSFGVLKANASTIKPDTLAHLVQVRIEVGDGL